MDLSLLPMLMAASVGALYATFDLLRKRLTLSMPPAALLVWLALAQVPLFVAMVAGGEGFAIGPGYWAPGLASIALNIVANVAFLRALEIASLGVTVPLLSLTPVFATLLSIQLLGELPSAVQMAGIVIAVVGAFALNFDPGEGATPAGVWRSLVREKGSLLMILVALCWSVTPAFDKLAVGASGVYTHGTLLNAGVGLGALAWLLVRGEAGTLRPRHFVGGTVAASAVVGFAALVLLLKAYGLAWVGVVETIRRAVNSALALVFGRWLFGETIRPAQIVAVVLMSLGVALVFF
ncbi:MAG: DMT family transporter [Acidobacteriota bacterium]|nr:DMT family transporter [Acidobacteriota bacterium]